jgi:mRNA interferase MazF
MTDLAPRRGDLIWVDFGAPSGREQAGQRPALVVSTDAYNALSSVVIVCPLSTSGKPWPFRVALADTDDANGYVLVDQVRVIDPITRHATALGKVGPETLARVDQLLAALFDLPDPAAAA